MLPSGLRCVDLSFAGEDLRVVSFALGDGAMSERTSDPLAVLTPAQREVALLLLAGLDAAAIAIRRGTSARTVGKQLEGIFRRLGIGSRRELVARFGASESTASR